MVKPTLPKPGVTQCTRHYLYESWVLYGREQYLNVDIDPGVGAHARPARRHLHQGVGQEHVRAHARQPDERGRWGDLGSFISNRLQVILLVYQHRQSSSQDVKLCEIQQAGMERRLCSLTSALTAAIASYINSRRSRRSAIFTGWVCVWLPRLTD